MSLSFGIAYLSVLNKLKKTESVLSDFIIKNKILEEANTKLKESTLSSDEFVHKENFIKFLSDSRDWAFDYIESSQKTIKEVSKELENKGLKIYSEKLLALLPKDNNEIY